MAHISAPETRIDEEERKLDERLSGLWAQRETHQRSASEDPEAARRLDLLAGEIDSLNRSLGDDFLRPDRGRGLERMARVASERSLGTALGR